MTDNKLGKKIPETTPRVRVLQQAIHSQYGNGGPIEMQIEMLTTKFTETLEKLTQYAKEGQGNYWIGGVYEAYRKGLLPSEEIIQEQLGQELSGVIRTWGIDGVEQVCWDLSPDLGDGQPGAICHLFNSIGYTIDPKVFTESINFKLSELSKEFKNGATCCIAIREYIGWIELATKFRIPIIRSNEILKQDLELILSRSTKSDGFNGDFPSYSSYALGIFGYHLTKNEVPEERIGEIKDYLENNYTNRKLEEYSSRATYIDYIDYTKLLQVALEYNGFKKYLNIELVSESIGVLSQCIIAVKNSTERIGFDTLHEIDNFIIIVSKLITKGFIPSNPHFDTLVEKSEHQQVAPIVVPINDKRSILGRQLFALDY